ncbi:MAG: FHA domain-containing protein [Ferruginibacter sp.]
MMEIFSKQAKDVKACRNELITFIKEQLQAAEGGEGKGITGLRLYIHCIPSELYLYEAALYSDDILRFQQDEIQRIADDYDIALPNGWKFEVIYNEENIPAQAHRSASGEAALMLVTKKNAVSAKPEQAVIIALKGVTEEDGYEISSKEKHINIGRGSHVQTADGFFRKNKIAFKEDEKINANRSVSRQHAHIEWDDKENSFILHADEGGIPPHNKMKVRTANGNIIKLQTTEIGHKLSHGDQVILGEDAVLEFTTTIE